MRPFWDLVSDAWAASRVQVYATLGASTGTPWPTGPGSRPYTVAERRYAAFKAGRMGRQLTRADLLRWLGGRERLYPSLTDPRHPQYVYRPEPAAVTLGTSLGYAGRHDRGEGTAPARWGGYPIPRRPLVALGDPLLRAIAEITSTYAGQMSQIAGSGRVTVGVSTADALAMLRGR